jgi:hypothetical protein
MKTKLITTIMITLFLATMLSMAFIAPAVATPDSGLVGLWHFDEGKGSTAADSSGNGNTGTLSGGKFGNALCFDGNDYVDVEDIGVTGDWTIEFWAKLDTVAPIIQYPIGTGAGTSYGAGIFLAYVADKWGLYDGTNWISGTTSTTTGVWYHIAVTKSGATYTLYLGGSSEASGTLADVDITTLQIGRRIDPGGGVWYFHGVIDEVRISNIARAPPFDLTVAPSVDANTVALWHFDESVGNIAYDSSGNNNHGTIYGANWAGPTWVDGRFEKALSFDGVDDYVWMQDNPSLDFGASDSFTLEAWIKTTDSDSGYNNIIRKDNYMMGEPRALWLIAVYNPGGKLRGFIYDGSGKWLFIESSTSVNDGVWHHVAFVRDAVNDKLRLYIDGSEDPVTPVTDTTIDTLENSGWGAIGAYANPKSQGEFFNGIIDEVRIYNEALSADWIKLHSMEYYSGGFTGIDNLVAVNSPAQLDVQILDAYGVGVEGVPVTFTSDPTDLTFDGGGMSYTKDTGLNGIVQVTAVGTSSNVYTVKADICGTLVDTWILVVYDPSAGFVTGGGWINSPAGAYAANSELTGKANFGFVSKYQKGAKVPTGQTQFVFFMAGLDFHSTSYEWLVVAGSKAQYKGTGTINGAGTYGFILFATDGQYKGGTGPDSFRIKIWDKSDPLEPVIYDNEVETAISGGSIVIHTK